MFIIVALNGYRDIYPFEMIPKSDHRNTAKHPVVVQDKLTALERVDVVFLSKAGPNKALRRLSESGEHHMSILEVLQCRACSSFQLVRYLSLR